MPCIPSARDITILYPVGIATMDTHRTLENKEKQAYSKQTHKAALQVGFSSNASRTFDGLVTEGCGQIDMTIEV